MLFLRVNARSEARIAAFRIPEETCCHSDSSGRPSTNAGVKNSLGVIMIIIIILSKWLESSIQLFRIKVDLKVRIMKIYTFSKLQDCSLILRYSLMSCSWYGFKYCYSAQIILFKINHLFARSLNGFKYCYLYETGPQPVRSCIFKIK